MIIDVQNVAMKHAQNRKFSCQGIQIVLEYWQSRGHKAIGFLPEYLLDKDKILDKWATIEQSKSDPDSVDKVKLNQILSKLQQLPDDIDYLKGLEE